MNDDTRFWSYVNKNGPEVYSDIGQCWLWKGKPNNSGYGGFGINNEKWVAHRYSYYKFNGVHPGKKCVLHLCDNRICVNPEHLRLGTYQDNNDDMWSKGRGYKPHDTHCKNGHEYNKENTLYRTKSDGKICRRCKICYMAKRIRDAEKQRAKFADGPGRNGDRKTCRQGHTFDESNTSYRVRKNGTSFRVCKICDALKAKQYRARNKDILKCPVL